MGDEGREEFAAFVRGEGADEETVAALVAGATPIARTAGGWTVLPKHVDETVQRAQSKGVAVGQLATIQRAGDALVRFSRARGKSLRAQAGDALHVPDLPLPEPGVAAPLPDERTAPRTEAAPLQSEEAVCPSCGGNLQLTEAVSGAAARGSGAIGGIGGFLLVRLVGCFGAIAAIAAVASVAMAISAVFSRWRCMRCQKGVPPDVLAPAQRAELVSLRWKRGIGAIGSAALAVVMVIVWLGAAVALTQ